MARAGRLRHRITLQSPAATQDSLGASTGWVDVTTVAAGIEPIKGRERAANAKFVDEVDTLVIIRWYAGVLPTWRVKHDTSCCGQALEYLGISAVIVAREIHHKDVELACRRVDTGEPVK